MRDRDIDDILQQAAGAQPDVDPALLERIQGSSARRCSRCVRCRPRGFWRGCLILICAAIAAGGALLLGPKGVLKMNALEIGLIFPALAILTWLGARLCVAEAIPGSPRPLAPWLLAVSGCITLAAIFALLFHDYRTERFVPQGMTCLVAGLAHALPASLAAWLLLSRGFAVNSLAFGLAKGFLAGLAGVAMLELHCPNFEAPHILVWHIAVLPVSAAAGMLAAQLIPPRAR